MRISNLLSAVCAAALILVGITVRAQDNPQQAAARAALLSKINELEAQQRQPTNPVPPTSAVTPSGVEQQPARQPANAAPYMEPASKPPEDNVVMTPVNPPPTKAEKAAAKAQAKADARQAAAELKAKKEAKAALKAQTSAKATATPADDSGLFTPVPPPSNPMSQISMPPAMQQTTTAPPPPPAVVPTPPVKPAPPVVAPAANPAPANASYSGKALGFTPITPPPPPVSAQKEAQLQALLAQYMANQITPEQYHKARAEILAQP